MVVLYLPLPKNIIMKFGNCAGFRVFSHAYPLHSPTTYPPKINMSTPIQKIDHDISQFSDHARALIAATADAAEQHVKEARDRLAEALDSGKSMTARFREQATARTRACDVAVHQNPYQAIGVAIGLGALLGFLVVRECANGRH